MVNTIGLILFAMAFSAQAESTYLYTEVSQPGETMDAFVLRVAPKANSYTKASGHEVCAAIREVDGSYSAEVSTSSRNDECALPGDTKVYFHTHPNNQGMGFSHGDYVRPGYLITQIGVKYQDGVNKRPRKVR